MLQRPACSSYAISSDGKPESHGTNSVMLKLYGQISHESTGLLKLRSGSVSPSEPARGMKDSNLRQQLIPSKSGSLFLVIRD